MAASVGKSVLKVLLGLVFIASAVLKLVEMDHFEIYVYSYHFFSFNLSCWVARAVVILELVLGLGSVSHCFHKLIWWGSIAMLAGYTLLLIYALAHGRTDNCHCFGGFLQFDPKQSLIKNGVLILLFLLIYRMKGWKMPLRGLFMCLAVVASIIAVFVISPLDDDTPEQNLQVEVFNEMLDDAPLDSLKLREGKQVVCFLSADCELCQMAAHKLSLMQQFYGFPADRITYLFVGDKEDVARFYEKSESAQYRDVIYPDSRLSKAIGGMFPTIVLLDNGVVAHEYGFRSMNEEEIKAFFVGF